MFRATCAFPTSPIRELVVRKEKPLLVEFRNNWSGEFSSGVVVATLPEEPKLKMRRLLFVLIDQNSYICTRFLLANLSLRTYRHETTLVSYQSKKQKNVLLLSTTHNKGDISEGGKPDIVLAYNKTKGGVDAMDQMAHAFTTKRKSKRWPMVYFYNIIDLASIASRVVFRFKFPTDDLSKDDNRQRFNLKSVARALVVAHIQRRATMSCHHEPVRQNIACVLKSLSHAEPATQGPPAKCAKRDKPATKQKRCSFCPAKDRKTKTTCSTCDRHICQEHAVTRCQDC
ncbi:PiggyBac transposable element-derived protein 4 [Plakobranchus ocellatus]|uniref:PiggyBac transposable element-derived protein 4 n=1 Tax=Plakobranchus ocellatus TaxID=259542 RepID=A0AAV4BVU3_9GAST|nr:PiggyBac transposable element-derived protein 4 [Plakobranchus ocellatus]